MLAVETQCVHCALEPCDMAVVVCAPDIDDLVEATLFKLVAVVSDVGGKIGVEAVCTAQNIVLELELVYILGLFARLEQVLTQYLGGLEP